MLKLLIKVMFNRIECSYVTHYLVSSQQSDGSWIPPSSWTGPSAAFYWALIIQMDLFWEKLMLHQTLSH